MADNKDAAEPESKSVNIKLDVTPGAIAQANVVKAELDRISQILNDVRGNTEAIKTNTETLEGLVGWSVKGIVITIILSAAAILVNLVH